MTTQDPALLETTAPALAGATPTSHVDPAHYRPDIDGLRAIAVISVLLFHGSKTLLPGGFTGVDVFFVISGYLISTIIFKDIARNRFSIFTFYKRRIQRIFPSLVTVLLVILAVGWVILFPSEFQQLGKHTAGGAAFISNILLWKENGYFAPSSEYRPLLHLWSLGVEEQFYIFFPVAMWLISRTRIRTTPFLVVLFAISLACAFYTVRTHPSAAFYLPLTRLWELLVGCILASVESKRHRAEGTTPSTSSRTTSANRILMNMPAVLGLMMILGSAIFLSPSQPFPGAWALLPTVGTALIIASRKNSFISHLLGNKLLVAVGLISYPLYLWHWPLLSLGRIYFQGRMPPTLIATLIAASVLLATLTYWLIEKPIRFGARVSVPKRIFALCVGMTVVLAIGIAAMNETLPSRIGLNPRSAAVSAALQDWDYPFPDNSGKNSGFTRDAVLGDLSAGTATLFIGDSHMQQYWPRIQMLLKDPRTHSRPVIMITAGGYPTLPNVNKPQPGAGIDRFFDYAMQEARRPEVGTVVFGCFWEAYFIGGYPAKSGLELYYTKDSRRTPLELNSSAADEVFADFGRALAMLVAQGKTVIVLTSSPSCRAWDPREGGISRLPFVEKRSDPNADDIARADFEAFISPVKQKLKHAVLMNGGQLIDPLDYFEDAGMLHGRSPTGDFLYKDFSHMRPSYIREKATFLDAMIKVDGGTH